MNQEYRVSIRQGCRAVGLARSTYRYKPKPKQDDAVMDELNRLVAKHPAIGFWQSYYRLRLDGRPWNHKRVYRIYTAPGPQYPATCEEAAARSREAATLPTNPAERGLELRLHPRQPGADATSAERADPPHAECS